MTSQKKIISYETRVGNDIITDMIREDTTEEYIQYLEEEIKFLRQRLSLYEVVD